MSEISENSKDDQTPSRQLVSFLIGFVITISVMNGLEIGASFLSLEFMRDIYEFWSANSVFFFLVVYLISITLGAASAGYVAREESGKYGIWATLPVVLAYHGLVVIQSLNPTMSAVTFLVTLVLVLVVGWNASRIGARYGKRFQDREDDEVYTFLNISWRRWVWFWIPVQFIIAQLVIFAYTLLLDMYAGWLFLLNPSLIQQEGWVFYLLFVSYFVLIPIGAALYFIYLGLEALQLNRKEHWFRELARFIFYFLIIPTAINLLNFPLIHFLENLIVQ